MTNTTMAERTVKTPNQAKALAAEISEMCYNDEIRAIFAAALLIQHGRRDGKIEEARKLAVESATSLVVAHDSQYTD